MNLSGTNLDHARRFNRRVVMEIVRLHGPLSRAEIARMTGLSAQTISNIVGEFAEAGLVRSVRRRTGARGQPAVDLELDPDGGFTFGVSFDQSSLIVLLVDVAGTVRDRERVALGETEPDEVLGRIATAVSAMSERNGAPRERVWGVGVVLPALLQQGELVALGPSSLGSWQGFPLRAALSDRLRLPVLVENDATAAAIGERLYGAAKSLTDFVYVYVGAGVGGGLFLRGHPYSGGFGKSGEIGHVVVEPGGRLCPCGNRGCLERYASLNAAHAALGLGASEPGAVDTGTIERAHREGDPRLEAWIGEAAEMLGRAVVILENCLDPETVILGGVLPEPVLEAIAARMEPLPRSVSSARSAPGPGGTARVTLGRVGIETPALGAATLPFFDGITPELSLLFKHGVVEPI
ncbi:ROK family transcriptional regulator [Arenibaculum sp.]|uniref:ROK family transcriptional regulator n=1 Tax=Arenibaculum sp. TaxID=2865862 RepID=UPI002E0EED27|nr:ROK family transcriptional regulator [Arenibaculum sp.]